MTSSYSASLPFAGGLPFTKGHGTENDFVLVFDADGALDLVPELVAALCDRRAGVGGDGLIRVIRAAAHPDGGGAGADVAAAEWFMDYHNADGSAAEMCGNGVRVFVAYLEAYGLIDAERLDSEDGLPVVTRGGLKRVRRALGPQGEPSWLAVDMGAWRLVGGTAAAERGHDSLVRIDGLDGVPRPALSFDLGNPHTVVALATEAELTAVDLHSAPQVQPLPPEGTNVELIVVETGTEAADGSGRLRMRVHERGVGETRSCGTGACAAALAAATWAGGTAPATWLVDVPGGQLRVQMLADERVELAGPAVLVAAGAVDLDQLAPSVAPSVTTS
jgi:diaminopimelate epimerase